MGKIHQADATACTQMTPLTMEALTLQLWRVLATGLSAEFLFGNCSQPKKVTLPKFRPPLQGPRASSGQQDVAKGPSQPQSSHAVRTSGNVFGDCATILPLPILLSSPSAGVGCLPSTPALPNHILAHRAPFQGLFPRKPNLRQATVPLFGFLKERGRTNR